MSARCEVLVVGGGPVGLLLGCALAQRGVDVRVIERRSEHTHHTRAIGVHPPGLACLAKVGVADRLVARGVKVRRGRAVLHGDALGEVDFAKLPAPFDFVLSVPQSETEQLLAERLCELAPDALMRETHASGFSMTAADVSVELARAESTTTLRARYVVGCDGRRSVVRRAMQSPYRGRIYRERFAMADARDETELGDDAVVFIDARGLIESFPLPAGKRRWVLNTSHGAADLSRAGFAAQVHARTGHTLSAHGSGEVSAFVAERFCAQSFVRERLLLAGDAAHVVSPIGGQGMNLGFLDALELARVLPACLGNQAGTSVLHDYARTRRRSSQRAARRAELYMTLGFGAPLALRAFALKAITRAPLRAAAARLFTMQGLTP